MNSISKPSRTRRLRKKLRVGEFQQFGFETRFEWAKELNDLQSDQFWDAFIDVIEANGLLFGGGDAGGFIIPMGRSSATAQHRQIIESWLAARPEILSVSVGPLVDIWYPPEDEH